MIIDIHKHITFSGFSEFATAFSPSYGPRGFPVDTLIRRLDVEGIDKAVLLPLTNPENIDVFGVAGNQECVRAARRHPDRLMAFCNVDPRSMMNNPKAPLNELMDVFKNLGCRGIGEVCANLPFTDPRCMNLYRCAGKAKMPILFHLSAEEGRCYGLVDSHGLPGLEEALKAFPNTVFVGHGPTFWAHFGAGVAKNEIGSYPKGEVLAPGRLWELLKAYPNLYGDLSAGSGFRAVSRTPNKGYEFFTTFADQLFFGTDTFHAVDEPIPEIIPFLKDAAEAGKISRSTYEKIMSRNFIRVFGKW